MKRERVLIICDDNLITKPKSDSSKILRFDGESYKIIINYLTKDNSNENWSEILKSLSTTKDSSDEIEEDETLYGSQYDLIVIDTDDLKFLDSLNNDEQIKNIWGSHGTVIINEKKSVALKQSEYIKSKFLNKKGRSQIVRFKTLEFDKDDINAIVLEVRKLTALKKNSFDDGNLLLSYLKRNGILRVLLQFLPFIVLMAIITNSFSSDLSLASIAKLFKYDNSINVEMYGTPQFLQVFSVFITFWTSFIFCGFLYSLVGYTDKHKSPMSFGLILSAFTINVAICVLMLLILIAPLISTINSYPDFLYSFFEYDNIIIIGIFSLCDFILYIAARTALNKDYDIAKILIFRGYKNDFVNTLLLCDIPFLIGTSCFFLLDATMNSTEQSIAQSVFNGFDLIIFQLIYAFISVKSSYENSMTK